MTREDVLAMPAGEALDALVAERVMGWTRGPDGHWWVDAAGTEMEAARDCEDYYHPTYAWSPSTDIAEAWTVVEHLTGGAPDRFGFQLTDLRSTWGWLADFFRGGIQTRANGDTVPLAICRAALLTTLA